MNSFPFVGNFVHRKYVCLHENFREMFLILLSFEKWLGANWCQPFLEAMMTRHMVHSAAFEGE